MSTVEARKSQEDPKQVLNSVRETAAELLKKYSPEKWNAVEMAVKKFRDLQKIGIFGQEFDQEVQEILGIIDVANFYHLIYRYTHENEEVTVEYYNTKLAKLLLLIEKGSIPNSFLTEAIHAGHIGLNVLMMAAANYLDDEENEEDPEHAKHITFFHATLERLRLFELTYDSQIGYGE